MSYPSSVDQVILTRRRPGPSKRRPQPAASVDDDRAGLGDENDELNPAVGVGGVSLDFGRLGAARLNRSKLGWEWAWASEERSAVRLRAGKDTQCLFPATRLPDALPPSDVPLKDIVDSAMIYAEDMCSHYERDGLRDALTGIIKDEHTPNPPVHGPKRSASTPAIQGQYDVYQGSTLALMMNDRARAAKTLLAFPTGEVGHCLNISPFLPSHGFKTNPRGRVKFCPRSKPVERFPTPILQICSSPVVSSARLDREATALVVRLQSTTHLLNVIPDPSYVPHTDAQPITCLRTASVTYEDTESRRHVDIAIDPNTWSRILLVDESGGVWLWWEEKEVVRERFEKVMNMRKIRSAVTDKRHQFFRIAFGTKLGTALVISNKEATIIDIDDPSHPTTTLMTLQGHGRGFTSLEKTALRRSAGLTCLATTFEVMWIDENRVGPPMLSWKHELGAGKEKDLDLVCFPCPGQEECTILYSRSRSVAMAFHTTRLSPVRSLSSPYTLCVPTQLHTSILPLPPLTLRHRLSLLAIAPNGEISSVSLVSPHDGERVRIGDGAFRRAFLKPFWNDEVTMLAGQARTAVGFGKHWKEKAETRSREMNFRWAWDEINAACEGMENNFAFNPAEFERYLREFDAPLELLMTASDLARDAFANEASEGHSHLLSRLPVSAYSGESTYDALDKIDIARHLPVITSVHSDILHPPHLKPSTATSNGSPIVSNTKAISDKLQETFPTRRHVNTAQHRQHLAQVALELSLAGTVLFSEELSMPQAAPELEATQDETDDLFARAAGQLSLQDREPAKIHFAFLMPPPRVDEQEEQQQVAGNGGHTDENERDDLAKRIQSLPARGLMSDWAIGEDPRNFVWKSWLDTGTHNSVLHPASSQRILDSQRPIKPLPSPRQPQFPQSQSQPFNLSQATLPQIQQAHHPVPSLLTSSTSLPDFQYQLIRDSRVGAPMQRSSPPLSAPDMAGGMADMNWASTQVEPGPFGGRLEKKGKKSAKKRMGGF